MKANVQYNDYVGSSAADISDNKTLNMFLESRGVCTDRYDAIGTKFYTCYNDFFYATIICKYKKLSTKHKKYIVSINFENEIKKNEFFDLFKRLNVILLKGFGGYDFLEIDKEISFSNQVAIK